MTRVTDAGERPPTLNLAKIARRLRMRTPQPCDTSAPLVATQHDVEFHDHAPADVAALLGALRETRAALVQMSVPIVALTMDAESRKWIAPSIWDGMIAAYKNGARVLETVTDTPERP